MPSRAHRLLLLAFGLLAGCDGGRSTLILQLKTDFVAGVELHAVEVVVEVGGVRREASTDVGIGDDFVEGARIAELEDVPAGTAEIEVSLLDAEGRVLASRPLRATYGPGAHAFTVLISRRCLDVTCPGPADPASATACVDGVCRDPSCSEENPERCGEPECEADADCTGGSACTAGACVAGRCFYRAADMCGAEAYCDPELGCRALPTPDAGVPDAGTLDAGPPDAGPPDAGPPPPVTVPPGGNACADADATGFRQVGRLVTGGDVAYGVWTRPPFVLVANTTGGVGSYRFDGASFGLVDRVSTVGWAEAIWSDRGVFYVSAPGTGLWTFDVASDGRFVPLGEVYGEAREARRAWGDGTHLYVPNGTGSFVAFRITGTELSLVGSTDLVGFAQGAFVDAGVIYLADGDALRAFRFSGGSFDELDRVDLALASRVWVLDGTAHVGHRDGVSAYRFDGVRLTPAGSIPTADMVRELWSDGVHLFAAAETAGVYAYRYASGAYVEVDRVDTGGRALGVVGDGTYLYVGDAEAGVEAYSGFACRRLR